MTRRVVVMLTDQERARLSKLITAGSTKARTMSRAQHEIATVLGCGRTRVDHVCRRYAQEGFAEALYERVQANCQT